MLTLENFWQLNLETYPSLTNKSRLKKGTVVRLRYATDDKDVSTRTRTRRVPYSPGEGGQGGGQVAAEVVMQDVPVEQEVVAGDGWGRVVANGVTLIVVPVHLVSQVL